MISLPRKSLFPIYFLTIINTFSFSLLIPVLPYLLDSYGVGSFMYGVVLSLFSLFQFFATPFLGSLSDRYGRRRILLVTQFGTFASWVVFALGLFIDPALMWGGLPTALWIILGARSLDGITGGNQSVANAYISDLTPKNQRTKVFGVIGMLMGVGIIVGPALGGLSVHYRGNFFGPILTASLLSAIVFLVILYHLRESLPREERETHDFNHYVRDFFIRKKIRHFLSYKHVPQMLVICAVFGFVFQGFTTAYVWYTIQTFELTLLESSGYMIMMGLFFAFNQGVVLRVVTRHMNDLSILLVSFVFLCFGLGGLVYDLGFRGFVVVTYAVSIGVSFALSSTKSLLTQYTPSNKHGAIIGIEESLQSANRIVAPLVAGVLWTLVGQMSFGLFGIVAFVGLYLTYQMITSPDTTMP